MLFFEKMISPSNGGHLFFSNEVVVDGTVSELARWVRRFDARRMMDETEFVVDDDEEEEEEEIEADNVDEFVWCCGGEGNE